MTFIFFVLFFCVTVLPIPDYTVTVTVHIGFRARHFTFPLIFPASGFNSAERKRERERRRARALKMLCALARMALVSPVSGGSLRCAIEWEDRPAPASQLTGKAQGRACLLTAVVSNLNVRNGRVIYFWNRTPTPFSGRIQMTLTRVMTPSVGES